MKRIENSEIVESDIDTLWELFSNIEKLSSLLPFDKLELEPIDENSVRATIGVKMGVMMIQGTGKFSILEKNPKRRIVAEGLIYSGTYSEKVEKGSQAKIHITVEFDSLSKNLTRIDYSLGFEIMGTRLKRIYETLINKKRKNLESNFIENLNNYIEEVMV